MKCSSVTSSNVLKNFHQALNGIKCRNVFLHITNIAFPNNVMSGDWLGSTYILSIDRVRIEDYMIDDIKDFNRNVFTYVITLLIKGFQMHFIRNGAFQNLIHLQELVFEHVNLKIIDLNALLPNRNLGTVALSLSYNYEISINGSDAELTVNNLRITNNRMRRTVTKDSFRGLTNLNRLDLSNNQIEFLPNGVFDLIRNSIVVINLNRNRLKTLSGGVLANLLASKKRLEISLTENPWHCDEHMIDLKYLLLQYDEFFTKISCETPDQYKSRPVINTPLKPNPTYSTTSRPGKPSKAPTSTLYPATPAMQLVCPEKSFLYILRTNLMKRKHHFKVKSSKDDRQKIQMNVTDFTERVRIFWIEQKTNKFGCWMNAMRNQNQNKKFEWIIDPTSSYLICAIAALNSVTTPLECISFHLGKTIDFGWITKRNRIKYIVLFIVIAIIFLISGVGGIVSISYQCSQSKCVGSRYRRRNDFTFVAIHFDLIIQ